MLNAVMMTQETLQPHSPAASETLDDEFDKDITRVYFGPFKTPERRFAAIAAAPDTAHHTTSSIPIRDPSELSDQKPSSPTLSTSTCSDEFMDVERLVGLVEEREEAGAADEARTEEAGLPENDEPSALLASKLLRALDNPSPPPSPAFSMRGEMDEVEADETEEGMGSSGEYEILPPTLISFTPETTPAVNSPPSISNLPSEPDLMTFDSIDDLLEPTNLPGSSLPVAALDPPSPFTFPDPPTTQVPTNHRATVPFQGNMDILVDVHDGNSTLNIPLPVEIEREQKPHQFEQALPASNHSPRPPDPTDSMELAPQTPEVHAVEDLPHTPLRRSSRPRKSTTPYLAVSSSNKDTSPPHSTPPSGQVLKSRKGKERAVTLPSSSVTVAARAENEPQGGSLKSNGEPPDVKTQRRHSRSPIRRELTRELGSLSPNSADLLTHLIPSILPTTESPYTHDLGANEQASPSTFDCLLPSTTQIRTKPGALQQEQVLSTSEFALRPFSSHGRIPVTPRRSHIPQTPSKLHSQPVSMDDPSRTPARRIPLEQAVAEGHISPRKLLQMQTGTPAPVSLFTGQAIPVLNTSLKGDASPARRIFNPPSTSHDVTSGPESPSKHRSGEPNNRQPDHVTGMLASQKAAPTPRSAKLPFPLVATVKTQPTSASTVSSGSTSPAKSALKQTTSRIPRSKPYSKPKIVPAIQDVEQRPTATVSTTHTVDLSSTEASSSKRLATTTAINPTVTKVRVTPGARSNATMNTNARVIRAVDLSKSKTSKQNGQASGSSLPDVTASLADLSTAPLPSTTAGSLKRKRPDSKIGPVASSRSTTLRQVHGPTTFISAAGLSRPTAASSLRVINPPSKPRSQNQATQKPTVMKLRRVMPPEPPLPPPRVPEEQRYTSSLPPEHIPSRPADEETKGLVSVEDVVLSSPVKEIMARSPLSSPHTMTPLPSSPSSPSPSPPPFAPLVFLIDPLSPVSHIEAVPSSSTVEGNFQAPSTRRTARLRKPNQAQPGTDVFSSNPNATSKPRPLQRRRTSTAQVSNSDDIFSGMSMNALKALTANNTVRNQHYAVAMLETQLVRKDGVRPESPAVKIKTILQRQQEEKLRQREERAARRARRHGGDNQGDEENNDQGYESPDPTSELRGLHLEKPLIRHKRGAGDEEDYETPLRNIDGAVNGQRSVKWDKGLLTEIFLDEVVLGSKAPPKENVPTKGCLTQSAKTLRLDNLGNLIDIDNPFSLTQENIVVKKFVYDDDVEIAPQPVLPVVRNTRSKSKKNKT